LARGALKGAGGDPGDLGEGDLEGLSRKQLRHFLGQKLKAVGSLAQTGPAPRHRSLPMRVVGVKRTSKATKSGKLQRFSATVVCGNGQGAAGFARGRAQDVSSAVDKAYAHAVRDLWFFPLFRGHTLHHAVEGRCGGTRVHLWPAPAGTGVRGNSTVKAIAELAGIKDLNAKVRGSTNAVNQVRAIFSALDSTLTPEEVALRRGREVREVPA